ncbi:MAG: halocyanin domain-containing protein [Halalkalicoccus sp.]
MIPDSIERRRFLRLAGVGVAAAFVAGCTEEEPDEDGTPDDDEPDENGETNGTGEDTADGEFLDEGEEPDYGGFLDDVPNYEGTYDFRGEESVDVTVGAGDQGLQFEPAAIMVDPGTTVVWEWTGDGGAHDVVAEDGSFESELVDEAGHTFEHTFEEPGVYEYVCTPHEGNGKKGVVAVDE